MFNEDIGPGTNINHGEDTVFIYEFLKKHSIYAYKDTVLSIEQKDSSWQGINRNVKKEIYSNGFIYYLMFRNKGILYGIVNILKHYKDYKSIGRFSDVLKIFKSGFKDAKAKKLS
jgi:hypothetical protein